MKTIFNLDRKKLDSQYIADKQNFDKVLGASMKGGKPFWKNPWFYGPTGLSAIALMIGLGMYSGENSTSKEEDVINPARISFAELEDTPCIKPISETTDLAFSVYSIDPLKGGKVILNSGTEINVDRKSLITSDDKQAVELRVREFQNKTEAFVAGVPMNYGENSAFESAGMIEIRASQNGKEVEINPENPIEVSLALYKNPETFKFWYLNEKNGKWEKHDAFFKNRDMNDDKKEIKKVEITLSQIKEKIETCDKSIDAQEQVKVENNLLPTLGARKLQIDFNEKDFPELQGYKDIEFEYVSYNEEVSKILKSQVWNEISLKKSGDYLAVFSNAKGSQSVKVRPVLKGKTLAEVETQLKQAQEAHELKLAQLQKDKESLQKRSIQLQAKYEGLLSDLKSEMSKTAPRNNFVASSSMINSAAAEFNVTRFGIFNCDKPIPYPNARPEFVAFLDKNENSLKPQGVYVFDLKKDCRYTYGPYEQHKLNEIGWNNNPTTIVMLDKEGRVFYTKDVTALEGKKIITFEKLEKGNNMMEELSKLIGEGSTAI